MRAAPLARIPGLLRDLGQDPAPVFAEVGVDPWLLENPESTVPFSAAGRLLAACANAADCPHFGLLLGQRTGLDCLGLVGQLVAHSPDLGQALRNFVLNLHLHDRGAVPTLLVILLCGEGSLESVAGIFSLHPRTLNRRLQGQGTSYRQLREECRQALACQYLRDTQLPVAEIAARLVYADSAAFTHTFRRWSSCTPTAWRAKQRAEPKPATGQSVAK